MLLRQFPRSRLVRVQQCRILGTCTLVLFEDSAHGNGGYQSVQTMIINQLSTSTEKHLEMLRLMIVTEVRK